MTPPRMVYNTFVYPGCKPATDPARAIAIYALIDSLLMLETCFPVKAFLLNPLWPDPLASGKRTPFTNSLPVLKNEKCRCRPARGPNTSLPQYCPLQRTGYSPFLSMAPSNPGAAGRSIFTVMPPRKSPVGQ